MQAHVTIEALQPRPMGKPHEVKFHGYGHTVKEAEQDAFKLMGCHRARAIGVPVIVSEGVN